MANTFALSDPQARTDVAGSRRRASGLVTPSSAYVTGGIPVTASFFGLSRLDHVQVAGTTLLGNLATWDNTNSKIKVYCPTNRTEAASLLDLSTDRIGVTAWGV